MKAWKRSVAIVATLGLVAGCRSLSIESDLRRADESLTPRIGFHVDWTEEYRGPESGELTVRDATRMALHRHPWIRSHLARVAERRADLVDAGLLPNPMLTLALGYPIDGGGGAPAMHGIMQDLSALWERGARVDASAAELRASVLTLSESAVALAANVGSGAARVHHGRRALALATEAANAREARVELLTALESSGESQRIEVGEARVAAATARRRELDVRERVAIAERSFVESLGRAGDDPAAFGIDAATLPDVDAELLDEGAAIQLAATQRLDVLAAFELAVGSDARARLASAQRWPAVSAGVSYNANFARREALGPMLAIEIPVFDTGRAALAKARAIELRSEAEAERILGEAIREVRSAFVALDIARERLTWTETEIVDPTVDIEAITRASFEAGEASRVEVLQRLANRREAELLREESLLAVRLAHYELWRAAGGALERIPVAAAGEGGGA